MSNRAAAVAATLQFAMPELTVLTASFGQEPATMDCPDGPVLVVTDGMMSGFKIAIHADERTDLEGLAADVFRAVDKTIPLEESNLRLGLRGMEPIFDEADNHTGERLRFVTMEQSTHIAA